MKYLIKFETFSVDFEGKIADGNKDLTIIPFRRKKSEQDFIATIQPNKEVIINTTTGNLNVEYTISLETFLRRCRTGQYIPEYLPPEFL